MSNGILKLSVESQCKYLDCLIQECGLYIRYGYNPEILSTGNAKKQMDMIDSIWNNLSDQHKPVWCTDDLIRKCNELLQVRR